MLVWSLALAWLLTFWHDTTAIAVAGFVGIAFGYSIFLATQFAALRWVCRADPVPPPDGLMLCRAWLGETVNAARVFFWRQPFRWHAWPDRLVMNPDLPSRRGIVFIHGFMCNRGFWNPWLEQVRKRGDVFVALNLEPVFASIEDYTPQLDAAVQQVTHATGQAPLLVCHSMGGLVARAWLRATHGDDRVYHIITMGSPHHGTWLGRFSHAINGQQMQQSSPWLSTLEKGESAQRRSLFSCYYSDCDNIVFPVSTATMEGAHNHLVRGVGHLGLAFDKVVMGEALGMLERADEVATDA